jgi:hypothetical protein
MMRREAPLLMNPSPSWHKYSWLADPGGRKWRFGSYPEIKFGWQTLKQAEHDTKSADQKRLAAAGMHLLGRGK